MSQLRRFRPGGWLPHDLRTVDQWIRRLKERSEKDPKPLVPPIQDLQNLVDDDPALKLLVEAMFTEAWLRKKQTPLGTPEVRDFEEFLVLLNQIMTEAPEYTECRDGKGQEEPCGLIGFPINALLDWPMGTASGYEVFANQLFNQQFKKILGYWSEFLGTPESRYVLVDSRPEQTPKVLAWLSETARREMVQVACQASNDQKECEQLPFEHFFVCDPEDPYYGFGSWDDFFTRVFHDDVRPVAEGDDVVANACESAPLQVVRDVKETDRFWLKGQPYALLDMMGFHSLAGEFAGGTVYQAFLSALSYHRWNSPVTGTVRETFVVDGTYYLENRYYGFVNPSGADDSAPNDSQPFLTSVATRGVIFIEADNPKIGLMCFVAVGMAEVSSCQITVEPGQRIEKGEELGMFHFGGSTHCLVFRPGVELDFDFHNTTPGLDSTNIPVRSRIATVR